MYLKPSTILKNIYMYKEYPHLKNLKSNPLGPLLSPERYSNFYQKCNVHPESFERINTFELNYSLKELLEKDYVGQFKRQDCSIFSIYSNTDKILDVNKEKIKFLEKKNHFISFIDGFNHGFPNNEPELCCRLIKKLIRNI